MEKAKDMTEITEAVDFEELQRLFARIPPGPYDALHRQDGWEVRQIDTDPGNKHHWPHRLCERIAGQTAECDDAVFPFIAGVINAWPEIAALLQAAREEASQEGVCAPDASRVELFAPPQLAREDGRGICVDACLALEVSRLWAEGITTTGCCCGHAVQQGYIGVVDADIPRMKAMGYLVHHNPCRPGDEDSFVPKSLCIASPSAGGAVAWNGRVHDLKTWPEPFAAIRADLKPWEFRLNDRDYQVGDKLRLREWSPTDEAYTGEVEERLVPWVLRGGQFGVPKDFAIMSLARAALTPSVQAEKGDERNQHDN